MPALWIFYTPARTRKTMKQSAKKLSRAELVAMLQTKGWDLVTGSKTHPIKGTLEELVRKTHARHKEGEEPGLIKKLETEFELDLIQLQELWEHLGLPM
jgi:hypothetical protein